MSAPRADAHRLAARRRRRRDRHGLPGDPRRGPAVGPRERLARAGRSAAPPGNRRPPGARKRGRDARAADRRAADVGRGRPAAAERPPGGLHRPGAVVGAARADPRRGDLDARRRDARPPVHGPAPALRRGRRRALHLPPDGRGRGDRRPHHGDALGRHRRDPRARRVHRPRDRRADDRHQGRRRRDASGDAGAASASSARRSCCAQPGSGCTPQARPLDVEIRAGELVGVAGLEGHGQDRFLRVLAGVAPFERRRDLRVAATASRRLRSPADALAHGIAYVPRDRRGESIFESRSIVDNFQLDDGHRGPPGRARPPPARRGALRALRRHAQDPRRLPDQPDHLAERRQPAEGRDRALARDEPARPAAQRPDARRRRRHQDRHLPRPHAARPPTAWPS